MPSLFKMNVEVDMIKSIMLGAREGFLWALRYLALLGLLLAINESNITGFYFIFLYGIMFGALPAIFFGALTGGLIHFVLQQRPKERSKAGLLGIKICLAVALPFNLLFLYFLVGPLSFEKNTALYCHIILCFIPTLFYLWLGRKESQKLAQKLSKQAIE